MMRYLLTIISFNLLSISLAQPQKVGLQFDASSIYSTANKLIGDSTCWPILITSATRDIATNSFFLDQQAQIKVKEFALLHKKVKTARSNLNRQIKEGAKVFAATELDSVTILSHNYDQNISEANIEKAGKAGIELINKVAIIEKLINERRTEGIDAKLAQKTGIVDKRKGLLGAWQSAYIGDLFASYDGVRTGAASLAQLFFTDGVDVTVDPNTIVVIRESRRDKLNQVVKRDIALVNGSLLTKLSAKAKDESNFAFRTGTSESIIKSNKFWASSIQDKKAKLSNYDGTINLTASNVQITLQQNQGTVVEKGKPPLPPVNLLTAPQLNWSKLDTIVYSDKIVLHWTKIDNSVSYNVEVCPSKNFDRDLKRFSVNNPTLQLTSLPLGSVYVRLQAVDMYGLRGVDSPVYQIIRVKDTQPPPIQLDGWDIDRKYTTKESLTIKGRTKSDALLTIDGVKVDVLKDGSFSFKTILTKREKLLKIVATDQSGNTITRTLSIVPIDAEKVFNIQWNEKVDDTTIYAVAEFIEARGNAYPDIKVTASIGNERMVVQTNSQGDWAISIKAIKGDNLRLTFDSITDEKTIGTKVWKVK